MKFSKKLIGFLILVAVLIVPAFLSSCTTVDAGHVGVVKRFGAVQVEPLPEGLHFVRPFGMETVHHMNARMQSTSLQASTSSKDLQGVSTTVTVQFSVNGALAPGLYQNFGNSAAFSKSVLSPIVHDSLKAVTARFSAEELVKKRSEVKLQVESVLRNLVNRTLAKKGASGSIEIANVLITDFSFSDEFDDSIEKKVQAEQDADKAINEKAKKITQAEAAAESKRLAADASKYSAKAKADAISYATEVESMARAEAMGREALALKNQPQLIELRRIEQWDGKLSQYSMSGGATPLISLK